jgi:hypothetical protein
VAYPPEHPPTLPLAIEYPVVPNTPAGADELEAWRRRQLVQLGITWGIPCGCFFLGVLFDALGLPLLTALAALGAVFTGSVAPGLTVVYLLRRRKARQLVEAMPRLPRASLRLGSGRGAGEKLGAPAGEGPGAGPRP